MSTRTPEIDELMAELDRINAENAEPPAQPEEVEPVASEDPSGPYEPEPIPTGPQDDEHIARGIVIAAGLVFVGVLCLFVLNHYLLFFPGAPGYP